MFLTFLSLIPRSEVQSGSGGSQQEPVQDEGIRRNEAKPSLEFHQRDRILRFLPPETVPTILRPEERRTRVTDFVVRAISGPSVMKKTKDVLFLTELTKEGGK